jgi:hypothetical protein
MNTLDPSLQREHDPDHPGSWELRACFLPRAEELFRFWSLPRDLQTSTLRAFIESLPLDPQKATTLPVLLRRAEAIQWELWRAPESPQAPSAQPDGSTTDVQATAPAQGTPEILSENSPPDKQPDPLAPADLAQAVASAEAAPEKRSRKRAVREGPQTRRASAVLNRIFPDGYPDEDEMAWPDVWNRFCDEYPHYAEEQ